MFRYRNRETGQTVEYRERNPRLDYLSYRWERLDDGGQTEPVEHAEQAAQHAGQAVEHAEQAVEQLGEQAVDVEHDEPTVEQPTDPGDPPARSANRAEWAEYAIRAGMAPARVSDMTKAQLVEHYR